MLHIQHQSEFYTKNGVMEEAPPTAGYQGALPVLY
jgi:hypothetical protein